MSAQLKISINDSGKGKKQSDPYINSWIVLVFFTTNTCPSILNAGGYYTVKKEYLCCIDLITKKMNTANIIVQGFYSQGGENPYL